MCSITDLMILVNVYRPLIKMYLITTYILCNAVYSIVSRAMIVCVGDYLIYVGALTVLVATDIL